MKYIVTKLGVHLKVNEKNSETARSDNFVERNYDRRIYKNEQYDLWPAHWQPSEQSQ